jgi:S-adenosylmethionine synthetase
LNIDVVSAPRVDHRAPGPLEVIERKGRGHPDTLSDRLAEELSRTYCALTREKFGTILRHQFDKLALMGGRCDVFFGGGHFRSPIRLLINGRLTEQLGDARLLFRDALFDTARTFLEGELRNFDFSSDCRVIAETSTSQTRGVKIGNRPGSSPVHHRFRPRTLDDIPEHHTPLANDTSMGCAWAPYSDLERLVIRLEDYLTGTETTRALPWIGSDVKIMATRVGERVELTVSVPQVSSHVSSAEEYASHAAILHERLQGLVESAESFSDVALFLNPGDRVEEELIYMKFTGSSIESGDEGVVGRGNRIGGLIAPYRPFTMEGITGKNPAYHAGKIYSAAAWDIANKIWDALGVPCEVLVASQMDRPLSDPWRATVRLFGDAPQASVTQIVEAVLLDVPAITERVLAGHYPLV